MHTLRLKLKTTEADEYNIERRFRAISYVHNILVRECIRRLNRMKYSAFLIRNTDDDYLSPDRDRCIASYDTFLQHQGAEIIRITREGADISPCFGLKKLRHVRTGH